MWNKVSAGDEVNFSARRENAISDLLNAFQAMSPKKGSLFPLIGVAITGYSPDQAIAQYTPVKIISAGMKKDLVWKVASSAEESDLWGITSNFMAKNMAETIILRGVTPAYINILDMEHCFAKLENGSLISTETPTICRIMAIPEKTGEQLLFVFLDGGKEKTEPYTEFKVTFSEDGNTLFCSGGTINRNGTMVIAGTKENIPLKAGTLCIQSKVEKDPNGKNGETIWTDPDYIYTDPAPDSWPIADIEEVEDAEGKKSYVIHQRITNIAILMVSKQCPLTKKGSM